MKFLVLLSVITCVACVSDTIRKDLDEIWEHYKRIFSKSYRSPEEESFRRMAWERSVARIAHHNVRTDIGLHTFRRGLNKYSDLTHDEYRTYLNGYRVQSHSLQSNSSLKWHPLGAVEVPDQIDWRESGLVTPVKDQGHCLSCWAFSTTGSLEGQHKKKTGKLVSLSEQNLVDCSKAEGNLGCTGGGWMDYAFEYIKKNNGVDTEVSYPYTALDGTCHFKKGNVGATCTGFVDIPTGDEEGLKQAVATIGPISAAIDSEHDSFNDFSGEGVYHEPECKNGLDNLTHGVLIVGYGTQEGQDYWLVKNSWGESFGDKGYIKMSRNKQNQCGIATKASYPLI